MLDEPVKPETLFDAQNRVEDEVLKLIRYIVIEAVKHGHELSAARFCKTMDELERIKEQKQRMINLMSVSNDPNAVKLSKEILQADFLVDGLARKSIG